MKKGVLAGIVIIQFATAVAQVTPEINLPKKQLLIGEPLELSFELKAVDRSAGIRWNIPDTVPHFEYLKIDSTGLFTRMITLTSWDSGVWPLPAISATISHAGNTSSEQVVFPATTITVLYDTTGSQLQHDVKPIIEVEDEGNKRIGYWVAAATLMSLFFLVYVLLKKKNARFVVGSAEMRLSPWEEFQETVQHLKAADWKTVGEQKQACTLLSDAGKRYFERIFRVPVTKGTTDDTAYLLQVQLPKERLIKLTQVLRLTDAVKFAKYTLSSAESDELLQTIVQVIQKTNDEHDS